jgi:hypothetical protein
MSKLSFGKPAATTKPAATAPVTTDAIVEVVEEPKAKRQVKAAPVKAELATPAKTTTALATPAVSSVGFEGELDSRDVVMPRLNVVNPTSKLCTEQDLPAGSLVFEKELILFEKGSDPLDVVVLRVIKKYQQKLPFDGDETPQVFDTRAEVEAEGGTVNYSKDAEEEGRFYQSIAHIVLAVRAGEEISEGEFYRFPHEHAGSYWACGVITTAGSGYKSFAVPVISKVVGALRQTGTYSGLWKVSVEKRSNDKNTWYVPVSKFVSIISDPEDLAFFSALAAEYSLDLNRSEAEEA